MEPMSRSMESSVGPVTEKQLHERSAISCPIRPISFGHGGRGAERVKSPAPHFGDQDNENES